MTSAAPHRVLAIGGSVGRFGRMTELSLVDISRPVVEAALKDAGIERSALQAAYVGNAFGGALTDQESILAQVLLSPCGIEAIPMRTIKNACSSGSDAIADAWTAIAWGQYDCVLVLGAEKLTHTDRMRPFAALATATDHPPQAEGRSVFMDINAERTNRYMSQWGAKPIHFAKVTEKNRLHASLNERAAVRERMTADAVLADKVVVGPLTRAMCGGIVDGAACIVLASETFAAQHGLTRGVRIAASGVVSGIREGSPDGNATRRAADKAYAAAGIAPSDVSVAEVHDPSSPQEMFDIEDLRLAERGGAIALVEEGATALGGRIPVNVSGGLTARGHPVGATGVAQVVEIMEQLQGRAGRAQVEGAKVGLAQMAGGLLGKDSAIACVHLLTR